MFKTIAAAILALSIASPVLAQSYDPDLGSGNLTVAASASVAGKSHRVADAYARADRDSVQANGSTAHDPDLSVQLQLNREVQFGF